MTTNPSQAAWVFDDRCTGDDLCDLPGHVSIRQTGRGPILQGHFPLTANQARRVMARFAAPPVCSYLEPVDPAGTPIKPASLRRDCPTGKRQYLSWNDAQRDVDMLRRTGKQIYAVVFHCTACEFAHVGARSDRSRRRGTLARSRRWSFDRRAVLTLVRSTDKQMVNPCADISVEHRSESVKVWTCSTEGMIGAPSALDESTVARLRAVVELAQAS